MGGQVKIRNENEKKEHGFKKSTFHFNYSF